MEPDFVYERMHTPIGVKVELVSGGERYSGRVWELMAKQVYAENGKDLYRVLGHLPCGAPFLEGERTRISLSHSDRLLAVATLPPTPEHPLQSFDEHTALGIDTESSDRGQVLRVRPKFLHGHELELVPGDNLEANIIAWTVKEAVWKAMLTSGLDFNHAITISKLPSLDGALGQAGVKAGSDEVVSFILYSYMYGSHIVTVAITSRTATYKKLRH